MSEVDDLREATREAREALKDLNVAMKQGREMIDEIKIAAFVALKIGVEQAMEEHLKELGVQFEAATERATEAVYKRFERVTDALLGETKQMKRQGEPSLLDYAEQMRELREGRGVV